MVLGDQNLTWVDSLKKDTIRENTIGMGKIETYRCAKEVFFLMTGLAQLDTKVNNDFFF